MKRRLPKMHEATADANAENVSNRSRPIVQSVWLAMACPAKPCVAVGPRVGPRVGPQVECVVAPPGIQVGLPVESKRDPCLNRWFDMGGHGRPWPPMAGHGQPWPAMAGHGAQEERKKKRLIKT